LRAGKLFAEACMGGLGEVAFTSLDFGPFWLPSVSVSVERPGVACMASQYAGWPIKVGKFFAIGSGPARALSLVEDLYQKLSYKDESDVAVIALEGRKLPTEKVAGYIARKCGIGPERLYILIAPHGQRGRLGPDFGQGGGDGDAQDDRTGLRHRLRPLRRRVFYTVRTEDAEIERVIERISSSSARRRSSSTTR
jgi:methenyltetrahydromethanopterin cyclohydrolase